MAGIYLFFQTTRLSSTRLPSRSLGEGWSRRGVREGASTLNPQLSILNFCRLYQILCARRQRGERGLIFTSHTCRFISALGLQGLLFAAASISNVKSEDQTPIFSCSIAIVNSL